MRGSCVLQVLQGPPRRAEGKGVKRSAHRERSSQSLATHPKQKSPAICAKRRHEADFCLRSSQSLATQPLLNAHNLKKITNFDHQTTNKQMRQTNNYEIAVGSVADIATIAQFQVDMALESEGTTLDAEQVLQGVTAAMNDSNRGRYFVARIGGQVIGSLMITREWSDWHNGWYWWVQSVYVVPEHRGKGVFRAIYAKVKELAAAEGVAQIRLYADRNNISAHKVYEKVGMEQCHYLMYEQSIK